jgi:hypothetical protein
LLPRIVSFGRTAAQAGAQNSSGVIVTITEPMTLLTDYLLAGLVAWFALCLYGEGRRGGERSIRLWSAAFGASALAALTGGTVHGFTLYLGPAATAALWKLTVYLVGLAGLFLLSGAAYSVLQGSARRLLLAAAFFKFLVYAVWMIDHSDFRFVIYDYAPSLLVVFLLQFYVAYRGSFAPAAWTGSGILFSFAAAAVQASGVDLHEYFNHNDLYHVVQMAAFYLLYRGGLLLRDR